MPVGTELRRHGDVDDAAIVFRHQGNHQLGQGEGADKVHVEGFADVRQLRVLTIYAHVARNACVVDQQRELWISLVQFAGGFLHAGEVGQFDVYPTGHFNAPKSG